MLRSLSVENFAVTKSVRLEFGPGFCALTGETGAGKSMMVDALSAALGARAEASWVRQGSSKATASAVFDASPKARAWLEARGVPCEESEVSLRRAVESEGRSKAWINGVSVSAAELRELGSILAAIHGQHESVALLAPRAQREHLDAYSGSSAALAAVGAAHRKWAGAAESARSARARAEELSKERASLAWELDELERAAPDVGEWEELEAEQKRFAMSSEIKRSCELAAAELSGDDGSVCERLSKLARSLGALGSPRLDQAAAAVEQACELAQDAAREIDRYREGADFSAERAAEVEARLSELYALSRKLRRPAGELPARLATARSTLAEIESGLDLGALDEAEGSARSELSVICSKLTAIRRVGAEKLAKAATANLTKLDMGKARLSVSIEPRELGPEGADAVEFLLEHSGLRALPLAKCASGGELARVGLAIAAASIEQDQVGCMVFDEVDAGVGGPTAIKVGRMLAKIGARSQALAVTHLPQVAACADAQWAVSKRQGPSGPESSAKLSHGAEREREVARMLGDAKSESALEHARALLSRR